MTTHFSPISTWLKQVLVVLGKDIAIERATGEIVATSGFFAVLVTVLASLAFSTGGQGPGVAPGVIWLAVAFASVLGLSRSWYREREESALMGLVLSPVARSAIFVGKALGTFMFVCLIEIIVLPCSGLLLGVSIGGHLGSLLVISLLANVGIAVTGSLFGAMTVRTRARDLVLASVLLPLLAPTLGSAIAATRDAFDGASFVELGDYLELLAVFDLAFGAAGVWLFGLLVDG
jgi:heme exporter protein B